MPGTTRWKPVNENPEAEEDVPGVLIVRLGDSLDFGECLRLVIRMQSVLCLLLTSSNVALANTAQLKRKLYFHLL